MAMVCSQQHWFVDSVDALPISMPTEVELEKSNRLMGLKPTGLVESAATCDSNDVPGQDLTWGSAVEAL